MCQPGADGDVVHPLVILAGQLCGQMAASKIAMQRIVVGLFLSFWATFGMVRMYVMYVRRYMITCAVNANANASCNSLIWFSIVHESNKACIDMAVLCQAVLVGWAPPEVNAAYL